MPDRFSEEEARRIFARAAERQHADASRPEGLSMAELEEIARASGIDPSHVSAAAAEIRAGAPASPRLTFGGVEVEPHASRVIAGDLSDEAWEQIVSRLRRTFGTKGVPSQVGRVREWTSGPDSRLYVTAEPVEGGTRIVLESSKAHEVKPLAPVGLSMVVVSLIMMIALSFGGEVSLLEAVGVGSLPLIVFLLAAGVTWPIVAVWSKKRQGQFDVLLDQIELVARSSPAVTEPTSRTTEPDRALSIDLDAMDEAEAEKARPRGRERA